MGLDANRTEEVDKVAMIENFECSRHESAFPSEALHEITVFQGVGQVATPSTGRFELGSGFGELFKQEDFLSMACGHDGSHHTCRTGTDDDKIVMHILFLHGRIIRYSEKKLKIKILKD